MTRIPNNWHDEYVHPEGEEVADYGTRWNWHQSEVIIFPHGPSGMAHRHPNGGGWVEDTAYVASSVEIAPFGYVAGNARVYGTVEVTNFSGIWGSAQVFGHVQVGFGLPAGMIHSSACVFGDVMVWSGQGECQSISRSDGRAFGEVIVMGGAGIMEGAGFGDVYGAYKAKEHSGAYLDSKYPSSPQPHSNVDPISGREDLDLEVTEHGTTILCAHFSDIIRKNNRDGFFADCEYSDGLPP